MMQFGKRLENIGARMQREPFAGEADKSIKPRIVVIIVAPEFAHLENTLPSIKKSILDFTASEVGAGFLVEVQWVRQPFKSK